MILGPLKIFGRVLHVNQEGSVKGERVAKYFSHKSSRLSTIHSLHCRITKGEVLTLDHVNAGILIYQIKNTAKSKEET